MRTALIFLCLALLVPASGCTTAYRRSLGTDTAQNFSRVFVTDLNTAWISVLEALKSVSLETTNKEAGFIQTRWTENTAQKSFTDSYGNAEAFLKAQYRVRVTVAKGFYNGKASVKVTVQKEQLVQRDVLEGWRPIETDTIEENTLLYRIGRIIFIKMKIAKLEEEKIKKSLDQPIEF